METKTPAGERLATLRHLHDKWSNDLQAAVGVNPDLALATAQALDDLKAYIRQLETQMLQE